MMKELDLLKELELAIQENKKQRDELISDLKHTKKELEQVAHLPVLTNNSVIELLERTIKYLTEEL